MYAYTDVHVVCLTMIWSLIDFYGVLRPFLLGGFVGIIVLMCTHICIYFNVCMHRVCWHYVYLHACISARMRMHCTYSTCVCIRVWTYACICPHVHLHTCIYLYANGMQLHVCHVRLSNSSIHAYLYGHVHICVLI